MIDAAAQAGVRRFVMVSYFGAGPDHGVAQDDPFFAYAEAKAAADAYLRSSELAWTVLGPGRLTLEPATGKIVLAKARVRCRGPTSRSSWRPRWQTTRRSGGPSNSTTGDSRSRRRWQARRRPSKLVYAAGLLSPHDVAPASRLRLQEGTR